MKVVLCFLILFCFGFTASQVHKGPKLGWWVCWANPTPKTLKRCREARTCVGSGVYAYHPKKLAAITKVILFCQYHFSGDCIIDYCERFTAQQ